MHTGRNDPCPCGSGKKYKKCCLPRDKEKEDSRIKALQVKNAALGLEPVSRAPGAVLIPPGPELPDDPETAALDALWDEFEAADYEGRIALFCKGMEEPDLIDADMAFEMLSLIHNLAVARDERDRFAAFVAALRERCPDCYENSASYYLSWLIEDRLALGRWEELTPLTSELAGRAGKDIDLFNRMLDALAYHGQLARLVEMMRIAWPEVNSSDNVVPWGVSEFADRATRYETFAYLEQAPAPQGDDPALIERINFYIEEPIIEYLRRDVTHLSGRSGRAWMLKDFEMRPPRKSRRDRDDDPASLDSLSAQPRVRRRPAPAGGRTLHQVGTGTKEPDPLSARTSCRQVGGAQKYVGEHAAETSPVQTETAPAGTSPLPRPRHARSLLSRHARYPQLAPVRSRRHV